MRIGIVTGASRGMGRDFVKELDHVQLDELWLIGRSQDKLLELSLSLQTKCRVYVLDLSDKTSLLNLKEDLTGNEVIWLVNSAGFGKTGKVADISIEDQQAMIDVNVSALTTLTSLCIPYLTENSMIVNFASSAAFSPQPDFAVYAATKSYVLSFSRALRHELRNRGVRVIAVCPGPVETDFLKNAGEMATYKKKFIVTSKDVVKQAIKDVEKGKSISVYSLPMKVVHFVCKVLPVDLVLKLYK